MSSSAAREWSAQYEQLKRRIVQLRMSSNVFSAENTGEIKASIQALDSQLKAMSAAPLQYEIANSELVRRTVLLAGLNKFMQTGAGSTSAKSSLMAGGGGGGGGRGNSPTQRGGGTYNPMGTTDRGLAQRQQQVMAMQDDMILDIEQGVNRLHGQALQIGDETKAQTRLLDDLDSNVDIATAALQAEAKHAQVIKDKAQVCWMYVCVAVEVIILFLLIVLVLTS